MAGLGLEASCDRINGSVPGVVFSGDARGGLAKSIAASGCKCFTGPVPRGAGSFRTNFSLSLFNGSLSVSFACCGATLRGNCLLGTDNDKGTVPIGAKLVQGSNVRAAMNCSLGLTGGLL